MRRIITFISDFGNDDWFVAAVKGEILKINDQALIIDITHNIEQFDNKSAAFLLKSVFRNFPKGTINLAVVDPGVGSPRKPLIVKSQGYYFVGPDNGIFSYIYDRNPAVYEIRIRKRPSSTFHARDVFAPTAARISNGVSLDTLGKKINRYSWFAWPGIKRKGNFVYGEIVHIDRFGNLITNINNSINLKSIHLVKKEIAIGKYYAQTGVGHIMALKGSCGFYEIAGYRLEAKALVKAKIGTQVLGKLG